MLGFSVGGLLIWLFWMGLGLMALLAFLRGMRALTEIPRRLERIEHLLVERRRSDSTRAP